ncbi:PaaI family thioesterase [Phenylobacterium aquaticum]|uniref:PaaI family thioesterase n=2 Tax=Phenylobacterium aquaticum TaxID=1763816 RepID=UPI0026EEB432|nr:PaaI family thioesterase [Phenylobacterium aquaticum]
MPKADEAETQPDGAGLSFFRELLRTGEPAAPICPVLSFELTGAEHGSTEFTGSPDARFTNPGGVVHGGYLSVILSSAMSCAVHTTLDEGERYTTTNINLHLTRALMPDQGPIVATGVVVHRSKRGATAEGRIVDHEGRLIAHGTTTCIVIPAG